MQGIQLIIRPDPWQAPATLAPSAAATSCSKENYEDPSLCDATTGCSSPTAEYPAGRSWYGQRPWVHTQAVEAGNSNGNGTTAAAGLPDAHGAAGAADPFRFSVMCYNILGDCYVSGWVPAWKRPALGSVCTGQMCSRNACV